MLAHPLYSFHPLAASGVRLLPFLDQSAACCRLEGRLLAQPGARPEAHLVVADARALDSAGRVAVGPRRRRKLLGSEDVRARVADRVLLDTELNGHVCNRVLDVADVADLAAAGGLDLRAGEVRRRLMVGGLRHIVEGVLRQRLLWRLAVRVQGLLVSVALQRREDVIRPDDLRQLADERAWLAQEAGWIGRARREVAEEHTGVREGVMDASVPGAADLR